MEKGGHPRSAVLSVFPEALRQTNMAMKERFEGLSAWKEKQREEREFLESRLEEARRNMDSLTLHNQELSKKLGVVGQGAGGTRGGQVRAGAVCSDHHICRAAVHHFVCLQATSCSQSAELDALRAQVARLQAEKHDLVAINSELQLKAEQDSQDDSFIEIIKVPVRKHLTERRRFL